MQHDKPNIVIIIPTYWTWGSERADGPVEAIYDHPTPVDGPSTLPRLLDSLAKLEGPPFGVLVLTAAAVVGAALGFLWWNAAPAKIFMGDTGAQALGGALAALALLTNTQLLLVLLGGLYVVETLSVIAQVFSFRVFGRRIFRIAPIHHHFEMKGWPETTVIIRFWILAGIAVALGVGVFYADFVTITQVGAP